MAYSPGVAAAERALGSVRGGNLQRGSSGVAAAQRAVGSIGGGAIGGAGGFGAAQRATAKFGGPVHNGIVRRLANSLALKQMANAAARASVGNVRQGRFGNFGPTSGPVFGGSSGSRQTAASYGRAFSSRGFSVPGGASSGSVNEFGPARRVRSGSGSRSAPKSGFLP